MAQEHLAGAYQLLEDSLLHFNGEPVGTCAAMDPKSLAAANYEECFVRDFVPSGLVFLLDGRTDIVRNFLLAVQSLRTRARSAAGHEIQPGVMPASFRVDCDDEGQEALLADFGERAIGRVAPVDSMMWWLILLYVYVRKTGDRELAERPEFQSSMRQILHICLKDTFEVSPGLLVPDACSMIDRRLGIYGHPLEIQALFYGVLRSVHELLVPHGPEDEALLDAATTREQALRNYVRLFYWLDLQRLNEIHRYSTEEFGVDSINMLNIYPESIPDWVVDWIPEEAGYLVGNVGPSRMDFRFFSLGNLLSVLFGLATDEQAERTVRLFESRWGDLVGAVPMKICYPAMEGLEWQVQTGSDPKNAPWSYQNGGNWPALLWHFVAATVKAGRGDLAERAYQQAEYKLEADHWVEYYDGRAGRLIGRRANFNQVWTATSLILAHKILEDPSVIDLFPR
ncbi:MAG: glycoside hydrolase 100 family protein [Pseudomonadota bacterium]